MNPLPPGHRDQVGHRLGHADRVHRHMGEVDPGCRSLGRAPQVGLGQVVRRDARQQIRGVDHEIVVQAHLPGQRAGGLLGHGHEDVGGRGVGPALEQAGQAAGRAPPSRSAPRRRRTLSRPGSSFCDLSSIRMAATNRNSESWLKSMSSRCWFSTCTNPSTTCCSGMSSTSTSCDDTRCSNRSIGPSNTGVETA